MVKLGIVYNTLDQSIRRSLIDTTVLYYSFDDFWTMISECITNLNIKFFMNVIQMTEIDMSVFMHHNSKISSFNTDLRTVNLIDNSTRNWIYMLKAESQFGVLWIIDFVSVYNQFISKMSVSRVYKILNDF